MITVMSYSTSKKKNNFIEAFKRIMMFPSQYINKKCKEISKRHLYIYTWLIGQLWCNQSYWFRREENKNDWIACFDQKVKLKYKTQRSFSADKGPLDNSWREQKKVIYFILPTTKKNVSKLRLLQVLLSLWQYKKNFIKSIRKSFNRWLLFFSFLSPRFLYIATHLNN